MATASAELVKETKCLITSLLTSNPFMCTLEQLCNDFYNTVGYNIPFQKLGFANAEAYLRSIPDTVTIHGYGRYAKVGCVVQASSAHINELVVRQKTSASTRKGRKSTPRNIPKRRAFERNLPPKNLSQRFYSNESKTIKTFENVQKVIDPHEMLFSNDLSSDNEKEEDDEAPFYNTTTFTNDTNEEIFENYKSSVPNEIQNNLRKLISFYPNGVWCRDLIRTYYKHFGKSLRFNAYNYRSVIEMCVDLPEIFNFCQPGSDDYLLYDKNGSQPPVEHTQPVEDGENNNLEEYDLNDLTCELLSFSIKDTNYVVPDDVCPLSYKIPRLFPDDFAADNVIDIWITEIYDLSKFWMRLFYNEMNDRLNVELDSFFKNYGNKYIIPHEQLLAEGLYCVVSHNNSYHRAVIVNLLPTLKQLVRVLFIDYGTVGDISTENVWYLPKKFGKSIPAQAIRTRLANIIPEFENSLWSSEAINRFRKLSDSHLVAKIIKVNKQDKMLEIYLADISNLENIFYVNDKLVEEGLAIYTEQVQKSTCLVDPNCLPKVKYIHLLPTFYDIEMGRTPTGNEINHIIANNIPMHHYLPQYFDIKYPKESTYINCQNINNNNDDVNTKPEIAENSELDLSIFPPLIQNNCDSFGVHQYSCSKKRLLVNSNTLSNSKNDSINQDESNQNETNSINETVELNVGSNNDENETKSGFKSTNPFVNMLNNTNPYLDNYYQYNQTNPFLHDVQEYMNNFHQFNMQSASVWGNQQGYINNYRMNVMTERFNGNLPNYNNLGFGQRASVHQQFYSWQSYQPY